MNKKLIALAVAGATVAPMAMAQTANPVTLYGRVFLTLESVKAEGSAPVSRRSRMQDNSSNLGVRGTEDLGGGLKAFFQLETSFAADQANSPPAFANRNSGIGLQGGWGSFIMGRWDMPFKSTTIALDHYGDLTIGGITAANNDQGNFDRRDGNVVQYWSPNFGGFAFRLAAQTTEARTADRTPKNVGASLTFTRGPMYLVAAFEQHRGTPAGEEEGVALGGSFRAGPLKFGLLAERFEKTGRRDRKSYLANVVWTAGNHQFIYQYQHSKDGGLNSAAIQPDCRVHQPGWQYNFSRRTFFLAQYARVDNNAASTCGTNIIAHTAGADPQGFSVGLRHVF